MVESPLTTEIYSVIQCDPVYLETIRLLQDGKKKIDIKTIPTSLKFLWLLGQTETVRSNQHHYDNIWKPVTGYPKQIRYELLNLIHLPYLGQTNAILVGCSNFWWKGMTGDIIKKVENYKTCIEIFPTLRKNNGTKKDRKFSKLETGEDLHILQKRLHPSSGQLLQQICVDGEPLRCQAEFQSIKETMTRDYFLKSFDISCITSMYSD